MFAHQTNTNSQTYLSSATEPPSKARLTFSKLLRKIIGKYLAQLTNLELGNNDAKIIEINSFLLGLLGSYEVTHCC